MEKTLSRKHTHHFLVSHVYFDKVFSAFVGYKCKRKHGSKTLQLYVMSRQLKHE